MSYSTIVKELARSLGAQIIAFDNLPDHGGCILYLAGPLRRIDISIEALDKRPKDLAEFVRQVIEDPPPASGRVRIGVKGGSLVVR